MKQNMENTGLAILATLVLVIFIAPVLDALLDTIAYAIVGGR